MARVQSNNLLFVELTRSEAEELLRRAYDIILNNQVRDTFTWPLFRMFAEAVDGPENADRSGLLMLSTAFPQRALLSYLAWCSENGVVPNCGLKKPAVRAQEAYEHAERAGEGTATSFLRAACAVLGSTSAPIHLVTRAIAAYTLGEGPPSPARWEAFVNALTDKGPTLDELATIAHVAGSAAGTANPYRAAGKAIFARLPDGGEPGERALDLATRAYKDEAVRLLDASDRGEGPNDTVAWRTASWKAFAKTLLAQSALEGG
jgi:hypothetical protein